MGDDVDDVQMPEVGSEWVRKETGERVTVIAIDLDNPLGPRVVLRFGDGSIDDYSVDDFCERFDPCDPAPPPMPTVADRWAVGAFVVSYDTEDGADSHVRRHDPGRLLVARMVCVEVREPRPAEEASDG